MVKIPPISISRITEVVQGSIARNRLSSDGVRDGRASKMLEATQLGEPLEVGAEGVAFFISESFIKDAPQTKAGIVVVQASLAERVMSALPESVKVVITAPDAYVGLAYLSDVIARADELADWQWSPDQGPDQGLESRDVAGRFIHPSSEVDATARLSVGVVISAHAQVGARSVILPNVVVGPGARIGEDCVVFPGVVLYPRTIIGDRVRLHANVVLGSDGFGYARGPKGSVKIWHLGRVVVEDDVEIGAGTMIDRGTLKDTLIERGAKIDNLVQIGHNGHVKSHAILCAQVGMAGNVTIGRGAILAGKAGIADKLEVGDGAVVGPMSGLSKDVKPGEIVMGQNPAKPRREWWKLMALIEKLPDIYARLKKLEEKNS